MTIAEEVWLYVKQKPFLEEMLVKGLVNYSALARQINKELRVSEEAIKAALIRITKRLKKRKKLIESKILKILKNSTLEVKTKVAIVVAKKKMNIKNIASFEGPSGLSYIIKEEDLKKVNKKNIVEVTKHADILLITSPVEIDMTPGVNAYLFSILANENINLLHVVSCYMDTLMMVHEVDTAKAFSILKEMIK